MWNLSCCDARLSFVTESLDFLAIRQYKFMLRCHVVLLLSALITNQGRGARRNP